MPFRLRTACRRAGPERVAVPATGLERHDFRRGVYGARAGHTAAVRPQVPASDGGSRRAHPRSMYDFGHQPSRAAQFMKEWIGQDSNL